MALGSSQQRPVPVHGFPRLSRMDTSSSTSLTIRDRRASLSSQGRGVPLRGRRGARNPKQRAKEDAARAALENNERLAMEYEVEMEQMMECYRRDCDEALERATALREREKVHAATEERLAKVEAEYQKFREEAKASETQLQDQLTHLTIANHDFKTQIDAFTGIRAELEAKVAELQSTVRGLENEVRDADQARHTVEHEASIVAEALKRAISTAQRENFALRTAHIAQEKELSRRMEGVQDELCGLIGRVETTIANPAVGLQAMEDFSRDIDLLSIQYRDLLQQCRLKAQRFASEIVKVSTLHSNLPEHIRGALLAKEPEPLVRIIDTLAFDESVRQYLEVLFPVPANSDAVQGYGTWGQIVPDTPSAALACGDLFRHRRALNRGRPQTAPPKASALHSETVRSEPQDKSPLR